MLYPLLGGLGLVGFAVLLALLEGRISERIHKAGTLVYVMVMFITFPYAMWWFWGHGISTKEVVLFVIFSLITGLGTGVGYHRLLTHGSFKTNQWIKAMFLIFGAMAIPTGPFNFAVGHYAHHSYADKEGDPHSPRDGFLHAHIGHILKPSSKELESKFGQRLKTDTLVMIIDKHRWWWFAFGLLIPLAIAGWPGLLWGGLVRLVYHNHVTFAVNSICHLYGDRPFDTDDDSRNNWIIGVLSFGEGFHNNHHAKAKWAYHGLYWWQFDLNGLTIRALERLGLAWDVAKPTPEEIAKKKHQLALRNSSHSPRM